MVVASSRIVIGMALAAGAALAGLSGEVRLPDGRGLPGVSIALRGKPELATTSGQAGRWSLGAVSVHRRQSDIFRPTRNLSWRDGRLEVVFQGRSADGSVARCPAPPVFVPTIAARAHAALDTLDFSLCAAKASLPVGTLDSGSIVVVLDTAGAVRSCDASTPTIPLLGFPTSWGNVTTYGGVDTSLTSSGGACNYGATRIRHYAAIQVNLLPGDAAGQWKDGRACGQGALVRAYTPQGVREVHVRIMDKCPDPHCGIDLGGAPAAAIMGVQAGRYQGEWTFVSCKGHPELFDGPTHLWTKEGTSTFWSLVQVRNPWTAVAALSWKPAAAPDAPWSDMPWATEAENFFKVPSGVFAQTDSVEILVRYVDSTSHGIRLAPLDLSRPQASYPLD